MSTLQIGVTDSDPKECFNSLIYGYDLETLLLFFPAATAFPTSILLGSSTTLVTIAFLTATRLSKTITTQTPCPPRIWYSMDAAKSVDVNAGDIARAVALNVCWRPNIAPKREESAMEDFTMIIWVLVSASGRYVIVGQRLDSVVSVSVKKHVHGSVPYVVESNKERTLTEKQTTRSEQGSRSTQ